MFSSRNLKIISLLCLGILLITAVLHIAYGSYFLKLGAFVNQYANFQPLSAFVITAGVYLILAVLAALYCLIKKAPISTNAEMILWISFLVNLVFTFSVALLEIREYVRMTQLFIKFGLSIPDISEYQIPLKIGLADGIISFVLGFPASAFLVYRANLRFAIIQHKNRLQIDVGNQTEDDSEDLKIQSLSNRAEEKRSSKLPRQASKTQIEEATIN